MVVGFKRDEAFAEDALGHGDSPVSLGESHLPDYQSFAEQRLRFTGVAAGEQHLRQALQTGGQDRVLFAGELLFTMVKDIDLTMTMNIPKRE